MSAAMIDGRHRSIRHPFCLSSLLSRLWEALLLLLIALFVLFLFTFYVPQPLFGPHSPSHMVTIPKGMSVRSIGHLLKDEGVILSVPYFVMAARLWGHEGTLQAGRYSFRGKNSIVSVLRQLTRGEVRYERVTIPEGLTLREAAQRLQTEAAVDSETFVRLATDTAFVRSLGIGAETLEGYLFPNTYAVHWGMDARDVIVTMVDVFKNMCGERCETRAEELGFSLHDVLTLASIIEREVMVPEERPIISAVFHNRLKLGRALESCATVEYALGFHKQRLSEDDLNVQSPYNTYLHNGLPPGPICSPGAASIEAALSPADVDYLYFVSEGNGRHIFSRSLEEHTRAKRRVKRALQGVSEGRP